MGRRCRQLRCSVGAAVVRQSGFVGQVVLDRAVVAKGTEIVLGDHEQEAGGNPHLEPTVLEVLPHLRPKLGHDRPNARAVVAVSHVRELRVQRVQILLQLCDLVHLRIRFIELLLGDAELDVSPLGGRAPSAPEDGDGRDGVEENNSDGVQVVTVHDINDVFQKASKKPVRRAI